MTQYRYVRSFAEITMDDVPLVGGKNASLGEMYQALTPKGIKVPFGFAITADAYRYVLETAGAIPALHAALDGLDPGDVTDLRRRGARAREIVYGAALPDDLATEIRDAYRALRERCGEGLSVAVRSSATAEDLPTASFAGQQESFLNIQGEERLIDACKRCFASLFTDRSIHYRIDNGFDHFRIALSVGVMQMVRADLAASGVIFTLDSESGFRDVVLISATYGLGENIVQGTVAPDEFTVHKPTYAQGYRAVLRRRLGVKAIRMVYAHGGMREPTRNIPTPRAERTRFCISDADVLALAGYAMTIEEHYSARAGHSQPMDIEWAKDGPDGDLYIVQARPVTGAPSATITVIEEYRRTGEGDVLLSGRAVGRTVASGAVRVIASTEDLPAFRPGEVLVADSTSPDWEPVMKTAAAIVTQRGGRTCHAAIVARELGIPAVVGADGAMAALTTGGTVTVSCAEGDTGRVYAGTVPFAIERTDIAHLPRPATKIMVNLGNPDLAFATQALPSDGVGLARMEFIINESIKAHPMALVHPERVTDARERAALARLTCGYARPADFFVERLSEGIGTIAAAFYPRPVIVRMSDFKSNEYAHLLGGRDFEPSESNPMLGFRGASRYAHPAYAEGFALECAAMKRVREVMGLTNVTLMLPFVRRVDEARRALEAMAEHGLRRGENGLEVYVMCEIPNNVIQIDAFSALFDGFSIGSNDLTQLTLGVDRDSDLVAFDYDERDPGMLEMLRQTVVGARRNGRHSGICGQAPSDYPEIAAFLVRLGVDSISLDPDSVIPTTLRVAALEQEIGKITTVAVS